MMIYIMKREAVDFLKDNLPQIYGKYYTESSNKWIEEYYGSNPFIEFKEIPEFQLADLDSDMTLGEIDLANCKIIYENMRFLSESQASDERLWAGLTHTVFYSYMRKRWKYGYGAKPQNPEKEANMLRARFFYAGSARGGFYRNTISKSWWVGHNTYDPLNEENHFESLDIIGSKDLTSKVHELFYSYTFSSNPKIMEGVVAALKEFRDNGTTILARAHVRPAVQYLNAVGGALLLDCLDKEEIASIFATPIYARLQGDDASIDIEPVEPNEELDPETPETESQEETVSVVLGSTVLVRNEDGKTKTLKYDMKDGVFPDLVKDLGDKKIGETVVIKDETWVIEDITIVG